MKWMPRSLSVLLFCSVLASCGGSGGSTVTPPAAVASVKVTAPSSLVEGQTSPAQAVPLDASGQTLTGRSISWASSDALVATVTAGGLITAIKPGNATISATSEGQVGSSALAVSIDPTPASILLTAPTLSIASGGSVQVTAVVKNGRGEVISAQGLTYASSATSIATVSSAGLVSSVGPVGAANITATIATVASAPAVVTVSPGAVAHLVQQTGLPASPTVASSNAISVKATDAFGNAIPGASVSFAVTGGGGAVTPTTAATDAGGIAGASFQVGNIVGANAAVATAAGFTGPSVSFSANTVAGAASVAGPKAGTQGQTAAAGTTVANSPAVTVTDAYGNPLVGVNVTFSTASDGTGQLAVVPTNSAGVAQLGIPWKLSATPGTNYYYANVGTFPQIVFTATGT
jgi:Bacterial Ig-like domain (group 1)/Bacterial Ig-like domain (group 2)